MNPLRQEIALSGENRLSGSLTAVWRLRRLIRRPRPDLHRGGRLCRPLPNSSATGPAASVTALLGEAGGGLGRPPASPNSSAPEARCEDCELDAARLAYAAGLGATEWAAFIGRIPPCDGCREVAIILGAACSETESA